MALPFRTKQSTTSLPLFAALANNKVDRLYSKFLERTLVGITIVCALSAVYYIFNPYSLVLHIPKLCFAVTMLIFVRTIYRHYRKDSVIFEKEKLNKQVRYRFNSPIVKVGQALIVLSFLGGFISVNNELLARFTGGNFTFSIFMAVFAYITSSMFSSHVESS